MRKLYILLMLSSLLFMSMTCDKALDDEERYSFDENGTPSYKWITSISKEKFSEYVVGNGWRMAYSEGVVMKSQDETQQSSSTNEPFLPHDLYFSVDSIFLFQYEPKGNWIQVTSFSYDETDNRINNPLLPKMQLIHASSTGIATLEPIGTDPFGRILYVHNRYEKMPLYELQSHWFGFQRRTNEGNND